MLNFSKISASAILCEVRRKISKSNAAQAKVSQLVSAKSKISLLSTIRGDAGGAKARLPLSSYLQQVQDVAASPPSSLSESRTSWLRSSLSFFFSFCIAVNLNVLSI